MMSPDDRKYMQRCLELARNGLAHVAPNPMVGAVVVHGDRILGEGYHTGFGKPHAEVEAITRVRETGLLKESTLYVNLEPCNHLGKTPPCTDLILQMGIPRVVIGQLDPHRQAGGGMERLKEKGIEVVSGVMEEECIDLNRRFNTFHRHNRPYLILKWAQSMDGFVDSSRKDPLQEPPVQITDDHSRKLVHKWRTEEQAILAGSGTIRMDNPRLDARFWPGRNPIRITIDRNGSLAGLDKKQPLAIFHTDPPTLVFTDQATKDKYPENVEILASNGPVLPFLLNELFNRGILSVLVEGGPTLHQVLIREGCWDEARVFIGPNWLGEGVRAPVLSAVPCQTETVGSSNLLIFRNPY